MTTSTQPPAGWTRHMDCLMGDLAGWEEAQADGHPTAHRMIQQLWTEVNKAEINDKAGFDSLYVPPGDWRPMLAIGPFAFYTGDRARAAKAWQLDADELDGPSLWRRILVAALLP